MQMDLISSRDARHITTISGFRFSTPLQFSTTLLTKSYCFARELGDDQEEMRRYGKSFLRRALVQATLAPSETDLA